MLIYIKCKSSEEYEKVTGEIHPFGVIDERFNSKEFNFKPYDNDCCDELADVLDELNVKYEMV